MTYPVCAVACLLPPAWTYGYVAEVPTCRGGNATMHYGDGYADTYRG